MIYVEQIMVELHKYKNEIALQNNMSLLSSEGRPSQDGSLEVLRTSKGPSVQEFWPYKPPPIFSSITMY